MQTINRTQKNMSKPTFNWRDPFRLSDQLSEEERMVRDAAHDYCQSWDSIAEQHLEIYSAAIRSQLQ